jgi:hypothetical protein
VSCAWNNYCIAVKQKATAIQMMHSIGLTMLKTCKSPEVMMLNDMLRETSLYMHLDMLIFERDNYITLIGEDMERNGDDWIVYMAESIRDKHVFPWLKKRCKLLDLDGDNYGNEN